MGPGPRSPRNLQTRLTAERRDKNGLWQEDCGSFDSGGRLPNLDTENTQSSPVPIRGRSGAHGAPFKCEEDEAATMGRTNRGKPYELCTSTYGQAENLHHVLTWVLISSLHPVWEIYASALELADSELAGLGEGMKSRLREAKGQLQDEASFTRPRENGSCWLLTNPAYGD
ncbi:hypothetical protein MHYP_G00337490 [Metynnis hypsauchen]